MSNDEKMAKFKKAILNLTTNQLLEHRNFCLSQLETLPSYLAQGSYMYKALQAIEDEMVGRGEE